MNLGRHISSNAEFNNINGIRGLAAILVLLSHTAPGWENLQVGLSLLFVISGFLLTKPFVMDSQRIYSISTLETFWTKRLKRILPVYYLAVFVAYGMDFQFGTLIRHLLFIEAGGHLWPMTQIFTFYMLLPLILLISSGLAKFHLSLAILSLAAAIYFYIPVSYEWTPFFNGDYHHPFYLYAFLMGVITSYLQYGAIEPLRTKHPINQNLNQILGLCALVFTITFVLWSAPMKPSMAIFQYVNKFYIKCIACAVMILFLLNTRKTIFNLVMANPVFRSVGVIGFSFYLWHGLGMSIFDNFAAQYLNQPKLLDRNWQFTLGAFVVTYIIAVISYSYVERPFFGHQKPKDR